ncbi:hypothetical protein ABC383_24760 [Noviherbaspirillum sp. 1P10PC]|uniref:hypothetical protein n=1 Tax=Noviherbaspirillum sp. 1P10PC TaxID=3132292 RepID=UPI0039A1F40E
MEIVFIVGSPDVGFNLMLSGRLVRRTRWKKAVAGKQLHRSRQALHLRSPCGNNTRTRVSYLAIPAVDGNGSAYHSWRFRRAPPQASILTSWAGRSRIKKDGAWIFFDVTKFSLPEKYFRSKVFSKPALEPGATILPGSGSIMET